MFVFLSDESHNSLSSWSGVKRKSYVLSFSFCKLLFFKVGCTYFASMWVFKKKKGKKKGRKQWKRKRTSKGRSHDLCGSAVSWLKAILSERVQEVRSRQMERLLALARSNQQFFTHDLDAGVIRQLQVVHTRHHRRKEVVLVLRRLERLPNDGERRV